MKEQLEAIRAQAEAELEAAGSQQALEELRIKYLGKKGALTGILKQMGKLSPEERPVIGQLANQVRADIEAELTKRTAELKAADRQRRLESEKLDVTLPGTHREMGAKHPLSIGLDEIKEIFIGMGFEIVEGPEVETDYYNFEALNIPRTIRPGIPRTPSILTKTSCCAPRPPRCRFAPWKSRSPLSG